MATNNTTAQFKLDLEDAFKEEVEEVLVQVTKKLAMEALSRVVLKSPVDTGRFRANWNVSLGSQDVSTTENKDKPGTETISKGQSLIESFSTSAKIIWVSNSLPYANRLENGWSKQSPQGMVALTFAELSTIVRTE